jgi:hypothetical protein
VLVESVVVVLVEKIREMERLVLQIPEVAGAVAETVVFIMAVQAVVAL